MAAAAGAAAAGAAVCRSSYLTGFLHPNRFVRVAGMGLMFQAMAVRSALLFKRELLAALAGCAAVSCLLRCSPLLPLGALYGGLQAWCLWQAGARTEYIRGHRAGAHGYDGPYYENTTEAMVALVEEDNGPSGPVPDLVYVEVDVQETADGELVVLHDMNLERAFPNTGPNVEPYQQLLREGHRAPPTRIAVQDLTASQLSTLHIAGRPGLHAPTLAEFASAFREAGCRRPLIVEVKKVSTDRGRLRLLQLLREHKPYADRLAAEHPEFASPHLGFLALIAFPHFYSACFGEFGTKAWRHWSAQFAQAGLPVRCCFLEALSYTYGIE